MADQVTEAGLSRRSLMKRGAVVGGIVWAAPVVASFNSPAGAQTNDTLLTPETGDGFGISNVIVAFTCPTSHPGVQFVVKYDVDENEESNVTNLDAGGNACYEGPAATSGSDGTPHISFQVINGAEGEPSTVVATLASGCVANTGDGEAEAKCSGSPSDSVCVSGVITNGGQTVTFSGCPAPNT